MKLFLWRHADALSSAPDFERELSKHGHKQARKVADWLRKHAPADLNLLVSPAVRTRQTAACFCDDGNDEKHRPQSRPPRIQYCPALYDSISPDDILRLLDWPHLAKPTLIVGHQPLIGALADRLLADDPRPHSFRKSALWHLEVTPGKGKGKARLVEVVDGDSLE